MKGTLAFKINAVALVVAMMFSLSYARAAETISVLKNQVYVDKRPDYCIGDIYQPSEATGSALPAVIVVHGGAWSAGSKDDADIKDLTQMLVDEGFVVFDINYRLIADGGKFPHNIDDVKSAVSFLSERASSYRVDATRMAILGVSAGAYLALMSAYAPHCRDHLKAVVALCPATDLSQAPKSLVFEYVDEAVRKSSGKLKKTSPLSFAKTAIPTLLLHGTADRVIAFEQSSKLERALKKSDVPVELVAIQGADHDFIMKPGEGHDLAFKTIERYLHKQLALERAFFRE